MSFQLGENSPPARRLRLSLGATAVAFVSIALAGAFGALRAEIAIDGCLAFALIAAASYAFVEAGRSERYAGTDFVSWQMTAAFAVLAWLAFRAGSAPLPWPLLYFVFLAYGALHLQRMRLAVLAGLALFLHGSVLVVLADRGILALSAGGAQFFMLALAGAWLIYATGTLLRLKERLAAARSRLHEAGREANERASRDVLTDTWHQRPLMDALEREIARADRIGKPLSIARVDLDWLGGLNEAHGRIAGDVALRRFTAAATEALRDVDVLGRYGGKEFLVVMPDTALNGAVIAADRVRASVGREPVPEVDGRRRLSCTLGVAEHRKGENTRLLIGRAEAGLSYAKAAGRDRVVALDADGKPMLIEAA